MKELTQAEEQIMQVLWDIKKGFVKDVIDRLPKPKPAYNTVSTIIRILEKKEFVGHTAYGKTHEYFPIVEKESYTREFMTGIVKNYFSNSFKQMVSFFANDSKISLKEIEEIKAMMEKEQAKTTKK